MRRFTSSGSIVDTEGTRAMAVVLGLTPAVTAADDDDEVLAPFVGMGVPSMLNKFAVGDDAVDEGGDNNTGTPNSGSLTNLARVQV